MGRERREFFPDHAGKGSNLSSYEAETWLLWMWLGLSCSSRVETGMSGNFLSCSKGVKDPLDVPEVRCNLPGEASAEMGLISPGGENLLDFLEFAADALDLRRGPQGPALVASGKDSPHACCSGASRDSSPVDAGA